MINYYVEQSIVIARLAKALRFAVFSSLAGKILLKSEHKGIWQICRFQLECLKIGFDLRKHCQAGERYLEKKAGSKS